jgi:riboflavin kinase/FMN adenylyltransferase
MTVFRHTEDLPAEARGSVLAIGNFDGVHLGHHAVLGRTRDLARSLGAPFAVLTFEPHPRSLFRPEDPPFRLTPLRVKVHALEELGVEHLFVRHFDQDFANISAEAFVREILVAQLEVKQVVVGWDFCFGHKRTGDVALLRNLGAELGFAVTAMDPVTQQDGEVYSSSNIRRYLREGAPDKASRLLGRPFEIDERVFEGDRRGRTLGFPTANLALSEYLVPAIGVYAVRAGVESEGTIRWYDAVANLGRRPTVDGTRLQLEVHLFDFTGDLYGHHLRVQLVERLRPEKKFDGLEGLKAQIARDCDRARTVLGAVAAEDSIG